MKKINLTPGQLVEIEKILAPYKKMYQYDYSKDEFYKSNISGYLLFEFYKTFYSYDQQSKDAAKLAETERKQKKRATNLNIRKARKKAIKKVKDEALKEAKKKIPNIYSLFADKQTGKAYKFLKILNVTVCPYCNINYTYTVFNNEADFCRPDIDHFLCFSKYPEKQITLTNMVPACSTCNSRLKLDIDFSETPHLNPYFESFDDYKEFDFIYKKLGEKKDIDQIEIILRNKTWKQEAIEKADGNIKDFALIERYQYHRDVVLNIINRIDMINKFRIDEICKYNTKFNLADIKQLIFPELDIEIEKESLGKLKKDIVTKYTKDLFI